MSKSIKHKELFHSIKSIIEEARKHVVRNVNTTMLITYFEIGRMIVEDEQKGKGRADYSEKTLMHLSNDLTKEFGKGYSHRNLEYIRKFYLTYSSRISQSTVAKSVKPSKSEVLIRKASISQSVIAKSLTPFPRNKSASPMRKSSIPQSAIGKFKFPFSLSWTHYIQLLKIEQDDERNFYEIEAAKNNWSVRELQRQYNSSLYERLALSRNKNKVKELSKKGQLIEQPADTLKNPFVLEFLDLKEDHTYSESDLETAIINKLEHFMLELGKGFLFEGRQKRFTFDGDDFFVDLVFYNRLLKCFVLFDLKIGKLAHQDIGQMQMYVNYYDRKIKLAEENPTIGIILCKEENKTVIEFTLPEHNKQIFAKEYKLYLPSKAELRKQLQ